jgi:nucleotide-binding universal stress UspA family protein
MDATGPVVLAVPDDDIEAALRFAVAEATEQGCGVRLVAYDAAVLDRTLALVRGVPTEGRIVQGTPVRAVLDASADARLVVVRRRDLLHLIRALTADDDVLPTGWSDPPVACVPPDWAPPAEELPATLGIEHDADSERLVASAAAVCGAVPVRPVHLDHARAGAELVARSARSRLVLLGRNAADERGGTRLGRTARTVLHGSDCPVVMLPPR